MDFPGLLEEARTLRFKEKRFDTNEFLEFVIAVSALKMLTPILDKHFGPPFKPAGKALTEPSAKEFLENFGGIRNDQTLYFLEADDFIYYAMIWPWSDGASVTIKIAQCSRGK